MFKNYLKIAWRNFLRSKSFSLINTFGLTISLSAFLIISLFIYDEWSYDRYHDDADKIFRVTRTFEKGDFKSSTLATANILAPTIKNEVPGVKSVLRINRSFGDDTIVEYENNKFIEPRFFIADPNIFDFFSYEIMQGNIDRMLSRPFTVVITESISKKYFGNENPLGKSLKIDAWGIKNYEVTGVIKDVPSNTHFQFDLLTSTSTYRELVPNAEKRFESWLYVGAYTYLKLDNHTTPDIVNTNLQRIIEKNHGEHAQFLSMNLQPLHKIHLYSDFDRELQPNSDIRYIYIFGSVALLILIIACINYINLATAKSSERALEVGVRKTFGVERSQIISQFQLESVITFAVSVGLAVITSELLLPFFNNIADKELSLPYSSGLFWVSIIIFTLLFSFISGFYPSFYLSRFKPSAVLAKQSEGRKNSFLRNGLIVFQFSISLILIIGTLVIHKQLDFIQNIKLGVDASQIISIQNFGQENRFNEFENKLVKISAVNSVSYSTRNLPITGEIKLSLYPTGTEGSNNNMLTVGSDFLKTLDIQLLKGNNLDQYDSIQELEFIPALINETAVKDFGWTNEPLGQTFEGFNKPIKVVGVVSDFHYESMKSRIEPLVISDFGSARYVYVNLETSNIRATISQINKVWESMGANTPFIYSFLDESYEQLYLAEDKLASIFNYFTILAVLISALGLLGLVAFSAERRTKEIGIRKVLGASVQNIVSLLSKDFIALTMLGFLIAVPVAWYSMNRWLSDFAYKIDLEPELFIYAGLVSLLITITTVSWQAIKAAKMNPIESLKTE